jgi:hypothetical protein
MDHQFIAKVYCNEEEIAHRTGEDIDLLYAWMLQQVGENFGDVHGEIIDNKTNQVVRKFRKAGIE